MCKVFGLSVGGPPLLFTPAVVLAGRLKVQAYCLHPEGLTPRSMDNSGWFQS